MQDIAEGEKLRATFLQSRQEIAQERSSLQELARDLHNMSEMLTAKDLEVLHYSILTPLLSRSLLDAFGCTMCV